MAMSIYINIKGNVSMYAIVSYWLKNYLLWQKKTEIINRNNR